MRRVVVTGIGAVTPLANGAHNTWRKLIEGQSGIKKINHFNHQNRPYNQIYKTKASDPKAIFNKENNR